MGVAVLPLFRHLNLKAGPLVMGSAVAVSTRLGTLAPKDLYACKTASSLVLKETHKSVRNEKRSGFIQKSRGMR